MKIYQKAFIVFCLLFAASCDGATATQPGGPTEILNNFVEAAKTKDIEAMKRALSKGTMERIEKSAQKDNTTVDELLKTEDGTLVRQLPETRSEKIDGETATLEVKNVDTGEFDVIPFIKEDGVWRLALDQVVKEDEEDASESAGENTSDASAANSGGNSASGDASNNHAANKNP